MPYNLVLELFIVVFQNVHVRLQYLTFGEMFFQFSHHDHFDPVLVECLEGKRLTVANTIKTFAYLKGMAGPQLVDPETGRDPNEKQKKTLLICPFCDKKRGHKTNQSKNCLFLMIYESEHYRADNANWATGKLHTVGTCIQLVLSYIFNYQMNAPDTACYIQGNP
jgi:hypothetical protein